ncbi:peptidylprolyl isomerase [Streptacidiphilus monticola]|uniref:Peptidylprolyl isomerase n=1 Tax=Streptacidiphilus monticola TaxID=2161674 RepID=A0ABW1G5W2_9ACTN
MSQDRGDARRARVEALRTQQARRKRAQRNKAIAAVVFLVLVIGAIIGGVLASESSHPGANSGSAQSFCGNVSSGSPNGRQWSKAPALTIDTSAAYAGTLHTSCGDVPIRLDAKGAPQTVNSFVFLAQQQYFDHTRCHRLTTSGIYVLQCGDPTGTGSGGPGYTLPDENLTDTRIAKGTYPAGTVAMANTGQAHTGGSQFFLVYQDSPLPPSYTPFGTMTADGLKLVQRIGANGTADGSGDGRPKDDVVINSVSVAKG